jgi:glucose/arabinose dehydrogenase
LNIIEKGKNYGWPVIVRTIDYPGTAIGEGITHKEGMEEPVYYWDPVIAPSRACILLAEPCFRSGRAAFSSAACAA